MTVSKRETELDILRLLAILAVIAMHAGGNQYLSPNFNSNHHSMFVASIVWCVPVFFMISGRFFLDPSRDVTIKKIWSKYLLRIVTVVVVWSAVYTLFYVWSGAYSNLNLWGILTQWIEGPYHFWYLYSLGGLYIVAPILRKITENEKLMSDYLILFSIANIVSEYIIYIPRAGAIINSSFGKLGLDMLMGYSGYYVLGYCIFQYKDKINKKIEAIVYTVGAIALVATVLLEGMIAPELQEADFVKQYLKPNVIIFSASIYTFFIKRVSRFDFSDKVVLLFKKLTELSFGVYILHALINEFLAFIPLPQPISCPYIVLFMLTVSIYILCLAATWLIRRIPLVGKKIT